MEGKSAFSSDIRTHFLRSRQDAVHGVRRAHLRGALGHVGDMMRDGMATLGRPNGARPLRVARPKSASAVPAAGPHGGTTVADSSSPETVKWMTQVSGSCPPPRPAAF